MFAPSAEFSPFVGGFALSNPAAPRACGIGAETARLIIEGYR
jgi:hypothetical protein